MLRSPVLIYNVAYINHDFEKDPLFTKAYAAGYSTLQHLGEKGNNFIYDLWRVYTACWAAYHASQLPGDFVECGVNTGFLARAIVEYINFKSLLNKKFYLVDTFTGVPDYQFAATERQMGLDVQAKKWYGTDIYEQVKKTFQPFSNIEVIKGEVPSILPKVTSNAICYLSIDMNCAYPEVAAVEYFYDKLVPGGIILLDDYGFSANNKEYIHQKNAHDELARKKGIKILSLPTGQGMIVKPGNVSPPMKDESFSPDDVIIF